MTDCYNCSCYDSIENKCNFGHIHVPKMEKALIESNRLTLDKKIKTKLKEVFEKEIEIRLLTEEELNEKNKLF